MEQLQGTVQVSVSDRHIQMCGRTSGCDGLKDLNAADCKSAPRLRPPNSESSVGPFDSTTECEAHGRKAQGWQQICICLPSSRDRGSYNSLDALTHCYVRLKVTNDGNIKLCTTRENSL